MQSKISFLQGQLLAAEKQLFEVYKIIAKTSEKIAPTPEHSEKIKDVVADSKKSVTDAHDEIERIVNDAFPKVQTRDNISGGDDKG